MNTIFEVFFVSEIFLYTKPLDLNLKVNLNLLAKTAFGILCNDSSMTSLTNINIEGHFKENGRYLDSHYRTRPNNTFRNNWSTYFNIYPDTGQKGHKRYEY